MNSQLNQAISTSFQTLLAVQASYPLATRDPWLTDPPICMLLRTLTYINLPSTSYQGLVAKQKPAIRDFRVTHPLTESCITQTPSTTSQRLSGNPNFCPPAITHQAHIAKPSFDPLAPRYPWITQPLSIVYKGLLANWPSDPLATRNFWLQQSCPDQIQVSICQLNLFSNY
jgi:hypothetical protein